MRLPLTSHRLFAAAAALTLIVALAPNAAAAGERIAAAVDRPFVFDGQYYEGGKISVRTVREFTPSVTLTEVWIDGTCLGMLRSQSQQGEQAARPALEFARNAAGQLELVGFSLRGEAPQRFVDVRHMPVYDGTLTAGAR